MQRRRQPRPSDLGARIGHGACLGRRWWASRRSRGRWGLAMCCWSGRGRCRHGSAGGADRAAHRARM